jgi:hypothetical protein
MAPGARIHRSFAAALQPVFAESGKIGCEARSFSEVFM